MIGSIIFILIGLLIVTYGMYQYVQNLKTSNREQTRGKIIKSQIVRTSIDIESGDTYNCQVEYKYKPKSTDEEILGNRILPFISIGNYTDNLKIHKKLKIGAELKVFYNPQNISQSCLIKGQNFVYKVVLITGIMCLLFGLLMLNFSTQNETRS